jgi:hypothetical protein
MDIFGISASCYPKYGLRPMKKHEEIAKLHEENDFKTGIDAGVSKARRVCRYSFKIIEVM